MNFKKASVPAIILRYLLPQMVGLVFNSVYFIVDGVFIGRLLGNDALAAAGVAVPVVEGMIALSMLVSVGTSVLIANSAGQGALGTGKDARKVFNISMRFTLALAVAIAILGNLFATPLARFLGAEAAILPQTLEYMQIFLTFSPFLIFSFALSTYLRNDGRPTLAMVALIVGSLSNILLDWVFMYPLEMGLAGAALATGLGPVFSVLIMLPHFVRTKSAAAKRAGQLYFARLDRGTRPGAFLGRILLLGMPAFVAEFSIGLVTLFYNRAIVANGLGEGGLAAYIVIGYAALIFLTAFLGAGQGIQPPVGYYTGAGMREKTNRLLRWTTAFLLVLSLIFYLLVYFGGQLFFGIFITGDAPLLEQTGEWARLYFICLPFSAVNILLVSFLQSMERPAAAMVVALSRCTLPVFIFLALLPSVFGGAGLWLAYAFAEGITLLLGVWLWVHPQRNLAPKAGEGARPDSRTI